VWLEWWNTCLASAEALSSNSNIIPPQKNNKEENILNCFTTYAFNNHFEKGEILTFWKRNFPVKQNRGNFYASGW
jgi:hypothetical protein